MCRLLVAILSRIDEQKAFAIVFAALAIVGTYLAHGVKGAGILVAGFVVIAVGIALSRKA